MDRARHPSGPVAPRCLPDPTIQRVRNGDFSFPLGVYPVEEFTPLPGYVSEFERADGGAEGVGERYGDDFEEWPDRYAFDVVVGIDRLPALVDVLLSLMPPRVYPIFDVIGYDAYREIDPYMSYELVGLERVIDGMRELRPFLFEDGMAGFGVMSEEPFMYLFIDEHKILTVRVEPDRRDLILGALKAFDLEPVDRLVGVDAANHEHRTVLLHPADQPEAMSPEEIIEYLCERWRLRLNVDPEQNVDDQGEPLGVTPWRCVVRCSSDRDTSARYAEVVLRADCLLSAEDMAMEVAGATFQERPDASGEPTEVDASDGPSSARSWLDTVVVSADRLKPDAQRELLAEPGWLRTPSTGRADRGTHDNPGGAPGSTAPARDGDQGVAAIRWMD